MGFKDVWLSPVPNYALGEVGCCPGSPDSRAPTMGIYSHLGGTHKEAYRVF
jgi:hypothetical protein